MNQLEIEIVFGNGDFLDERIDLRSMYERGLNPENFQLSYEAFRRKVGPENIKFGDRLVQSLGETGTYTPIRQYEVDSVQHIVFRQWDAHGLNYHDFQLAQNDTGRVWIVDFYNFLSGSDFSDTFRDLFLNMKLEEEYTEAISPELLLEMEQKIGAVAKIGKFREEKDWAGGKAYWEGLPAYLRYSKPVMADLVDLGSRSGPEAYGEAISAFEKAFPGDPGVWLLSLDYLAESGQYADLRTNLDKLERRLGMEDPPLEVIRANSWFLEGNAVKAQEVSQKLANRGVRLEDNHWVLLNCAVALKNWPEALRQVEILQKRFELQPALLLGVEAYEDFISRSDFREMFLE